jgi:hypothetical protein
MRGWDIAELLFGAVALAVAAVSIGFFVCLIHHAEARTDSFVERCMREGMLPKETCEWVWAD